MANRVDFETANRVRRTVARSARLPAPLTVEAAVSAAMCTLTERLSAGEAHELLAAVPPALRPMFTACSIHEQKPVEQLDFAAFVAKVADHLDVTPAHAELVCSAVFSAVRAELPEPIIASIATQLPHGLKELWLGPPRSAPDLETDISNNWIRRAFEHDLERRAKLPPGVTAGAAFAAVMCALTRRLSGGEAKDVFLGLPSALRPLLWRCALHRAEGAAIFGKVEMIHDVAEHLSIGEADAERVAREVLHAAKRNLPQETIEDVAAQLPADLRELWGSRGH